MGKYNEIVIGRKNSNDLILEKENHLKLLLAAQSFEDIGHSQECSGFTLCSAFKIYIQLFLENHM